MVKTQIKEKKKDEKVTIPLPGKIKTVLAFLVVLAFAAYGFYIRHLTAGKYFSDPDTFYHFEIYKLVLKEGLPRYYPMADAPFGSLIGEPLGLYILPAIFYKIISIFGYNELEAFLLWPPFVGFLSVIGVYLLGRKVLNEWAGMWGAIILSVLTANFSRTFSGNARGDGPFMMLFTFSAVLMLYYLTEENKNKKIIWGTLFVLLAGISTAAWNGSPFGLMVLLGFASFQTIILFIFGKINELREFIKEYYPAYLGILAISYLLTIPGIGKIGGFVRFAFEVFLGLVFLAIVMLYGGKYLNYSDKKHRFAVVAVIVIAGFAGAYIYVGPKLFTLMGGAYQSTQVYETVQELAKTDWGDVKVYYGVEKPNGIVFFLGLVGAMIVTARYLYKLFKDGRRPHEELFAITFYVMSIYLLWTAARFLFLASYAIALMSGVFAGYVLETVEKMKESIPIKAALGGVIAIMLLLIPLTHGPLLAQSAKSMRTTEIETSGWEDALKWLRENTPEYSTATSWWDYGYWIESSLLGQRRASADGGHARDRDHILALFLARDGNISEVDFESWELNYFLVYLNDWAKFNAISYLGGAITRREYNGDESGRGAVTTLLPLPRYGEKYVNLYAKVIVDVSNSSVKVTVGDRECDPLMVTFTPSGKTIKGTGTCSDGNAFPYVLHLTPTIGVLAYYKVATANFIKLAFGVPASTIPGFSDKLFSNFEPVYESGNVIVYRFTPFGIYKIEENINGTWKQVYNLTPGKHELKLYISAFGRDIENATLYIYAINNEKIIEKIKIAEISHMDYLNEYPIAVNVTLPNATSYRFVLVQKGPIGVLLDAPKVNGEIRSPTNILREGESGEIELKVGVDKDYTADLYLRATFIYLVRKSGKDNEDYDAAFEPQMDVFFITKIGENIQLKEGENTVKVRAELPEGVISSYKDELQRKYGDKLIIRGIRVEPVFIAEKEYLMLEVSASAPYH